MSPVTKIFDMKPLAIIVLGLFFAIFEVLFGHVAQSGQKENIFLRGKVEKINRTGGLSTFMFDEIRPDGTESKILVIVTGETRFSKQVNQVNQQVGFEDLKEGMEVEVKFKGPIVLSYPAQGKAENVRIIEVNTFNR